MKPLVRELLLANRTAQHPDAKVALTACGLGLRGGPVWGVGSVTVQGEFYTPALPHEIGSPAVIVPAVENGAIVDLVATGLLSRKSKTRRGVAVCLGADRIERARWNKTEVRLYADPLLWLCAGAMGAVILDLAAAWSLLADTGGIVCGKDDALAVRVQQAMARPFAIPPIYVWEGRHES